MENEKEQIAQLYRKHYNGIYSFFFKRLRSPEDAADSAQEVFIRLVRHNGNAALDSPVGYMWKITRNLIKEIRRAHTIRSRWMSPLAEHGDKHPSKTPGPEEAMKIRQMNDDILNVFNKLPSRCREVFILHRFKGLSHKEIADQLNISPKTVENHMAKALLFLRKNLPRP
ncbi:MAG TPA: sigma-70 family RNA polymerase sigma factor [Desulfocapsa sulfexigens]|nr:sigma-70 family RNA polymerase sigma factor [Desulfocapsa sulfexigens]HIQ38314.1 sigma-70 family RNA polymerase sigma factor [Desulfocapsa sulfexigens]